MAADKYDSLFIQDDEPIENLRVKKPPPPFEECSSSDSEGEPEAPKPTVLARQGKPPLIFASRAYGNKYRAQPPDTTLAWRPSNQIVKRAEDIRQANEVLDGAWKRQIARSRPEKSAEDLPKPHRLAPASIDGREDHATPPTRECSVLHTASRQGGLTSSERAGRPSQLKPQRSRVGVAAGKRVRPESQERDLGRVAKKANIAEAGSMLLDFFEDGEEEGGV